MIAALPMYERPETRGAHDRLWQAVLANLGPVASVPAQLTRTGDVWALWEDPSLLVAQTCGLPYRARLHDVVTLVGTPDYGLPRTPPGHYHSVIIARAGWTMSGRPNPAINDALSQSGWAALYLWSKSVGMTLGDPIHSGAHSQSASLVADGEADIAAIDAVTWRFLESFEPSLTRQLTVIGDTPATPGLPLITAQASLAARLFDAFDTAISELAPADRTATGLQGMTRIPSTAYLSMPIPPSPAAA